LAGTSRLLAPPLGRADVELVAPQRPGDVGLEVELPAADHRDQGGRGGVVAEGAAPD
jgi:hypothetical protein